MFHKTQYFAVLSCLFCKLCFVAVESIEQNEDFNLQRMLLLKDLNLLCLNNGFLTEVNELCRYNQANYIIKKDMITSTQVTKTTI